MKKIILLFFLLAFSNAYSQELYLGKTISEIQSYITHKATVTYLSGRKSICEEIDSNTTDVYLFKDDICIEYSRLSENKSIIDSYLALYSRQFDDNIWLNSSVGLIAKVEQITDNLYKVSFRKIN